MAGVISRNSFAKMLWPGLNAVYGKTYNDYETQYTMLFDTQTSSKAYEEDLGVVGLGLAQRKTEGEAVTYDEENQAYLTRYMHYVFALGFIVTREEFEDNQYGYYGKQRSAGLARSLRQTKEINGANVYNRAFTAGYVGGDGVTLCNASHPNYSGGTWSNMPSVAVDLSEAALEQAAIDISKWTDDRGLKIKVLPRQLIIPVDLQFEAERILKSPYRVGTADNDVNAIKSMGFFQNISVNHYLTDTNAWFIRTDCPDGMKHFQRRAMEFGIDNDFDTENAKYKASERYSFGWTNPRAIYGTAGA